MKESKTSISEVADALQERGFDYFDTDFKGWLRFKGALRANGGIHICEILMDPLFHDLPQIKLTSIPPELKPVAPHVAEDGGICYLAKNAVVVDIFDPIGQTLAFLIRAEFVLDKLLRGEMVEDMEEEFFAFWNGTYCLTDLNSLKLGSHRAMWVTPDKHKVLVACDEPEVTKAKLRIIGWSISESTVPVYRVTTTERPRPAQTNWPPKTVSQLLQWQGSLDLACRKKLYERIVQARTHKTNDALILIESPLLTYGVLVRFENGHSTRNKKSRIVSSGQELFSTKVTPCSVMRIDDRYLTERNIPSLKTLTGKNITVVGCGTIGGYLSEILVKAGAGTGGGQLTLIDNEYLMPNNLGRHRLGFASLFKYKAKALGDELRYGLPYATIRSLPVDVRCANLSDQDLIIDATGEEALGHWLAGRCKSETSVLSVWIDGPGTAVRGLFSSRNDGACYRCLFHHAKDGRYQTVHGGIPTVMAGHGCEGMYVPFPATVSIQAASLGADMALQWVNEKLEALLQTRLLEKSMTLNTPDCTPEPHPNCPVCAS